MNPYFLIDSVLINPLNFELISLKTCSGNRIEELNNCGNNVEPQKYIPFCALQANTNTKNLI